MEFLERRKGNQALINITSLIDVMFLLLIFLVVTSTFREQAAIDLTLPRSASAEPMPQGPAVVLLTVAGEIYLDDRRLGEEELGRALRQRRAATGEDRIVLRADARSQHGQVVKLIDLVRASGFTKVSLSARRDEAAGAGR